MMVFPKEVFKKVNSEKISRRQKIMQNYPTCKDLNCDFTQVELALLPHELTVSGLRLRVCNKKNIFLISQP